MGDLNIYQRINAVMQEIDYVKKDTSVSGGGANYRAVTHDAVVALVRKEMVKQGIVVRTEQVGGKVLQLRDVTADIKQHFYRGRYNVHFVNIDQPDDFMTVSAEAHATDTQDKAPGKAMSYAVKYAMLKTFSIETGENEEGRYHEAPLFTDHQKARFDELIEGGDDNAIALAAFAQEIGHDAMAALQQTFKPGEISARKKRVKDLEAAGWDKLRNYADLIKELLSNGDPAVLELTGELEPVEKRLVAGLLTDIEVAQLRKIKETAA